MTHRERILATIRGEPTDRIPWAPRMDLWAIALRARDAVPPRFAGLNTAQIADELDVACHAMRGDVTLYRDPSDLALRGLGIDNHPDHAFRVEIRDLPLRFKHDDGRYETVIETPVGEVSMCLTLTQRMAGEGISLPFVEKYPICSLEDFEPVARVFEHLEVVPKPEAYAAFHDRIGERGVAAASGPIASCPVHSLLHDVMAMQEFFVMYHDERTAVRELAERMTPFFDAMIDAVLACKAEVVYWGSNYDHDTTWPPFFEAEIVPWLQKVGRRLRGAGKLLLTHTDGENRSLLPLYPRCAFDVGESVCPAPMTSCTLAEIREGMGPKSTVWGGIPCVVLIDEVTEQADFEKHMDTLFAELGSGARLVLGVSDNVPPDVNMSRLEQVKQWIDSFGPVRP